MNNKTAGDLMVPLDEYPVVDAEATVLEAVTKLETSRLSMEAGRQPFRAVLITDKKGNIIGKLGQLTLLRALEPNRRNIADQATLDRAWVNDTIIETALDHIRAFQHEFTEMCRGMAHLPVRRIMHPVGEHIDIGASIDQVIHRMVAWQRLSLLVTQNEKPVGLVRLSDLSDAVISEIRRSASENIREDSVHV